MRGLSGLWWGGMFLLACGGITERQVADEHLGGRDAGTGAASSSGRTSNPPSMSGGSATAGGASAGGANPGGRAQGGAPTVPRQEGSPCYNDSDCPGAECGGQVCDWARVSPTPVGEKLFYCRAAGGAPLGTDGWCTTDSDCKCRGLGARCAVPYCTFTLPENAK